MWPAVWRFDGPDDHHGHTGEPEGEPQPFYLWPADVCVPLTYHPGAPAEVVDALWQAAATVNEVACSSLCFDTPRPEELGFDPQDPFVGSGIHWWWNEPSAAFHSGSGVGSRAAIPGPAWENGQNVALAAAWIVGRPDYNFDGLPDPVARYLLQASWFTPCELAGRPQLPSVLSGAGDLTDEDRASLCLAYPVGE
jgi:hypothetical protein